MALQKVDQQYEIRFLVRDGKNARQIIDCMQRTHPKDCLSVSFIHRWVNWFSSGQDRIKNLDKSGAPKKRTAAKLGQIQGVIQGDRRSTIREVSRQVQLSYRTVQKALKKDLNLCKKSATWVPHFLTAAQKQHRVCMCRDALRRLRDRRNHPVDRIVAQDESWMFTWDPGIRQSSMEWVAPGQPRPQKPRIERTTVKVMLIAFIDRQGVIYREFVPNRLGINAHLYVQILDRFWTAFRQRRPQLARQEVGLPARWSSGTHCPDDQEVDHSTPCAAPPPSWILSGFESFGLLVL